MRFVFSPKYSIDIGDHAFPTRKFEAAARLLLGEGLLSPEDGVEPRPPAREQLLLVHTADWVDRALSGRLTLEEETLLELPCSKEVAEAHALSVSGTLLACRLALEQGLGLHFGGGSHHAFADHGEGFCVFNDIACGVRQMLKERRIERAMVVDLDVHQGNGTASIFAEEPAVFTFSMHQENLYPLSKPPGSLDIGLEAGTGDAKYLKILLEQLPAALDSHRPQLVVYQAGVDVYAGDMLGELELSADGIARRDEAVFEGCFSRSIPIVLTLGGGYASSMEETAALHAQTAKVALRLAETWRIGGGTHV